MTRQPDSHAPDMPVEYAPDQLTPGSAVGSGRYRLLERVGRDDRVGATFWRARDSVLDRDVGVTTLTGAGGPRSVQTALAADQLNQQGIARVLDALSDPRQAGPGLTGLIVTEWVAGPDLASLAIESAKAGRTLPSTLIARTLSSLAAAVDVAHRSGLALGTDDPQRIRVAGDGVGRLAFPVASGTGQLTDDVRGLGAAIYLLMTGRWPLPNPPAGLQPATFSSQSLRPVASPTLATLAQRCLAGASANGVYTGAAVHQLLEQVGNAEADTMLMAPVPDLGTLGPPGGWPANGALGAEYRPAPDIEAEERVRRRKLSIAMAVLGVAVLVVFGWIGSQVVGFLSDDASSAGPSLVVPKPTGAGPAGASSGQPVPAGPIQAAGIQVFNVAGDPDNPNRVSRAIDGNPRSSWKTFDYNQPFPTLKPGVGMLISFAEPVTLAAVHVESPSAGSTIEIRTAPSGEAGLAGSTVLGSATLAAGHTEIQLNQTQPSQRLLLWITGLASVNGKNATEILELAFLRSA